MSILYDAIRSQAKVTNSVLVGFSGGKDSICCLDLCLKYFQEVQPFFMYLCPNLSFQEEFLTWYEEKYNVEILRIPHFEVSNYLRYGTFREPDMSVSIVGVKDTYDYLRNKTGIYWIAAGERIADSIVRRAMIKKSGPIDVKRGRFYPLANWTKEDVMHYIKAKRLKLPKMSTELGFSFRSLEGSQLSALKNAYPEDYEKILKMYPFAGAAVERFERFGK